MRGIVFRSKNLANRGFVLFLAGFMFNFCACQQISQFSGDSQLDTANVEQRQSYHDDASLQSEPFRMPSLYAGTVPPEHWQQQAVASSVPRNSVADATAHTGHGASCPCCAKPVPYVAANQDVTAAPSVATASNTVAMSYAVPVSQVNTQTQPSRVAQSQPALPPQSALPQSQPALPQGPMLSQNVVADSDLPALNTGMPLFAPGYSTSSPAASSAATSSALQIESTQSDVARPARNQSPQNSLPNGKLSNNSPNRNNGLAEPSTLIIRGQSPESEAADPFASMTDPFDASSDAEKSDTPASTASTSTPDSTFDSASVSKVTTTTIATETPTGQSDTASKSNATTDTTTSADQPTAKHTTSDAKKGWPTEVKMPQIAFSARRSETVVVDPNLKTLGESIVQNPQVYSEFQNPGGFSLRGAYGAWPQDEYLVDGGDDGPRAHVRSGWDVRGVEQEDTIGHYDTLDHRTLVEKSNRVHIYSPRFGSVRKVDGAVASVQWLGYGTIDHRTQTKVAASQQKLGRTQQKNTANYARTNLQLRSADTHANVGITETHKSPMTYSNQEVTHSLSQLLMHRIFSGAEMAYLAQHRAAAVAWGGIDQVAVIINELPAQAMIGTKTPEATFIIGEPKTSPRLQLFKVASKDSAVRGEIVEFMIRFDNTGSEIIGNVTIIDSLTARLEYISGSAGASLPAEFFVEPNEVGSLMLRWEIKEPLKAGDFGVVRFRCRVQ